MEKIEQRRTLFCYNKIKVKENYKKYRVNNKVSKIEIRTIQFYLIVVILINQHHAQKRLTELTDKHFYLILFIARIRWHEIPFVRESICFIGKDGTKCTKFRIKKNRR